MLFTSDAPKATPTATMTTTVTTTVTATPTIPAGSRPARMGQVVHGDLVAATVLDIDPNTPVDSGIKDQDRWYSALVRVCATVNGDEKGKPIEVSWAPWSVADDDGARFNITGWTGGIVYPLPTYPQDSPVRLSKGQCVKGWITFNVLPSAKVTRVIYGNGGGEPIERAVSAKG